jgi:hypothetical protein
LTPFDEPATGIHCLLGSVSDKEEQEHARLAEFNWAALLEDRSASEAVPPGRWRLSRTQWIEWEMV